MRSVPRRSSRCATAGSTVASCALLDDFPLMEKRLLKVLKGLAEYLDLSLGDLLEGIALHALENKPPFEASTLEKIVDLRKIYELDLKAEDSHQLREK